ncbi:HK97 family phage prohead protease [Mycobacterium sp.]|uniref:HK97 family phage prohead protease n=1 Tax=Mycobacterium sp. TaxID=1785 RepID=UPI003F96BA29
MRASQRQAPEPETRTTALPVKLRAAGARRVIGGYAASFGGRSGDLGGFHERVSDKAFNKSAGDGWPGAVARFNHLDEMLLGTTRAQTLRLAIDSTGLFYEVDLPESRADVLELVTRGDVSSSSFAFECWSDSWGYEDGTALRTLESVRLLDVAPVTRAAYPDATVGLRSLARFVDAPIADVIDLSNRHELRKLFTRTDGSQGPPGGKDGRAALLETLAKRWPDHEPKDGRAALLEVLGKRWPQDPPRPRSGREALTELLGKRWPQ